MAEFYAYRIIAGKTSFSKVPEGAGQSNFA